MRLLCQLVMGFCIGAGLVTLLEHPFPVHRADCYLWVGMTAMALWMRRGDK